MPAFKSTRHDKAIKGDSAMLFKVTAKKKIEGNYNVEGSCRNGHTSYKKAGDTSSEYKCPYCGHPVP